MKTTIMFMYLQNGLRWMYLKRASCVYVCVLMHVRVYVHVHVHVRVCVLHVREFTWNRLRRFV